ncbi:unnamed protein product [Musa textilis]
MGIWIVSGGIESFLCLERFLQRGVDVAEPSGKQKNAYHASALESDVAFASAWLTLLCLEGFMELLVHGFFLKLRTYARNGNVIAIIVCKNTCLDLLCYRSMS